MLVSKRPTRSAIYYYFPPFLGRRTGVPIRLREGGLVSPFVVPTAGLGRKGEGREKEGEIDLGHNSGSVRLEWPDREGGSDYKWCVCFQG